MSIPPSSSTSQQFTYAASQSATVANGAYFPTPFHLQQSETYPKPYVAPPPTVMAPVYPPAPIGPVYSLPQYQQAHQLFQRDAQTITPEALESVKAALANSEVEHKAETKRKAIPRKAAGQTWEDPILAEWPENDYRVFCGDLGNEVNDDVLSKAFSRFPSFNLARSVKLLHFLFRFFFEAHRAVFFCVLRPSIMLGFDGIGSVRGPSNIYNLQYFFLDRHVVRDNRTGKTKGYGFVSFANPTDLAAALKEMNGKYVGNRPIKLRKSNWRERTDYGALERQKNQSQRKPKLPKKSVLHNPSFVLGIKPSSRKIM
ncbi:RNA-binding protein 42-like [Populus alba x Populus x berolinensis]|uniref:RNA-binding protein 42-like n=1 Tax=Populus alba x Populus x berolinensis TaxID=444605 RepID=A0AAD6PNB7_9ROSI|nr:RNA-binding protein 42-like [Populus alba x Populus x berolinensis]